MYVVAAVKLEPKPLTVIVASVEVAVKLYHTSFVGLVAPAQLPLGDPVLVAFCRSPEIVLHAIDGESGSGLLHKSFEAWE